MRNTIITTVCAALISTALVQPAFAETQKSRDVLLPLLFGAATIYILKERNDRKKERARTRTVTVDRDPVRPNPYRFDRKVLPANCFKRVLDWDRKIGFFGLRCLNKNYAHVQTLPSECRTRIHGENGKMRKGFSARCLRRNGFRMSSS